MLDGDGESDSKERRNPPQRQRQLIHLIMISKHTMKTIRISKILSMMHGMDSRMMKMHGMINNCKLFRTVGLIWLIDLSGLLIFIMEARGGYKAIEERDYKLICVCRGGGGCLADNKRTI